MTTTSHAAIEVKHFLGEQLLTTQLVEPGQGLRVGSTISAEWSLMGRRIGRVPTAMALPLAVSPPVLSEVREVLDCELFIPSAAMGDREEHELIRPDGPGWSLRLDPTWPVVLERDGQASTLIQALGRVDADEVEIPIEHGLSVAITFGAARVEVRQVTASPRLRSPARIDRRFGASSAATGMFAALFLAAVLNAPPAIDSPTQLDPDRLVEMRWQAPIEAPPIARQDRDPAAPRRGGSPSADKGAADDKGRAAGPDNRSPRAGLLDMLADPGAGLTASLDTSISSGILGLIGAHGTQLGQNGLAGRGDGFAGGGGGDRLGGLGDRSGGFRPLGPGYPGGSGDCNGCDLGRKAAGTVSASSQESIVLGKLDRGLIDGVVKRRLPAIRYCYSRELQRDTSLAGKVTIKFTIAQDGSVSTAGVKSSTLGHSTAESCMVKQFHTMHFPEPAGGGYVVVSYPFVFAPG